MWIIHTLRFVYLCAVDTWSKSYECLLKQLNLHERPLFCCVHGLFIPTLSSGYLRLSGNFVTLCTRTAWCPHDCSRFHWAHKLRLLLLFRASRLQTRVKTWPLHVGPVHVLFRFWKERRTKSQQSFFLSCVRRNWKRKDMVREQHISAGEKAASHGPAAAVSLHWSLSYFIHPRCERDSAREQLLPSLSLSLSFFLALS